jgi:hypothetical protein
MDYVCFVDKLQEAVCEATFFPKRAHSNHFFTST